MLGLGVWGLGLGRARTAGGGDFFGLGFEVSEVMAVVINGQRPTGRSHSEATAAIGQGDLCGEF